MAAPFAPCACRTTNPAWAGFVIPQEYSPINGDAGEASEIELEWAIVGAPVKRETPTVVLTAEEAEAKSSKAKAA